MYKINNTTPVFTAKAKATDTEEFSGYIDAEGYSSFVLTVEVSAFTSGTMVFNIYTNVSGASAANKTLKATAISITGTGTFSFTIPEVSVDELPSKLLQISVAGTTLAATTFSAWVTRRV